MQAFQLHNTLPHYRPKWIRVYGQEYHPLCILHVGWQPDDLPVFAKVISIIVLVGVPLSEVELFFTEGINCHIASYLIVPTGKNKLFSLSTLDNKEVHYAHTFLGNRYICMRSHIERLS